jgi:16S rRNA (adenine1518-N6/adenine1519-N6)-dimethyltransferase
MSTGHRPRKRFGQHFLIDDEIIGRIVNAIAPQSADIMVEIGPGEGAITNLLAARSGTLHAIEFDRDLAVSRPSWPLGQNCHGRSCCCSLLGTHS